MKNKTLHFKTNVQLKSIIGKDLINDDNIAILELVKNAFDANAKKVTISYINQKINDDKTTEKFTSQTSRLLIVDNGMGMNIQDIQDKWLNIAYSGKKLSQNQFNRRMAGAKGVGRFSCDRLGEFLNLYTKTKNEQNYIQLSINWKDFEVVDSDKEIQTIPLDYHELTPAQFQELGFEIFEEDQGLLLEIIKLRSVWSYPYFEKKIKHWSTEKYISLKKYLEKLINPNQAFETNDFGVYIEAPEFSTENNDLDENSSFIGKVENRIFDKLEFKSTSIEFATENNGKTTITTLKDKGKTVYWIKEINKYYPFIKDVKLTIYYLNTYAKAFFTRQTGTQSVNYGSVFLFINGFRIPPYGDPGNDWLSVDQRKAQGTKRFLGTRDIIGHIEINDSDNSFQIISSREGIVNNYNFKKLIEQERNDSFYYKAHRRLEKYVVQGLNWDSTIYETNKQDSSLWKDIEGKIIRGELNENELEYREDIQSKNSRIYSSIHNLISARPNDVLELYINENLILDKIEIERAKSEREFTEFLKNFNEDKVDSDLLSQILNEKINENKFLKKQISNFDKFSIVPETADSLRKLTNYQNSIEDQERLIKRLQEELISVKSEKDKAIQDASNYKMISEEREKQISFIEVENQILEDKLSTEIQKNEYLSGTRKTLSADADQLVHTIDLYVRNAKLYIDAIILDKNLDDSLGSQLYDAKESLDKAIKVSELIIKSQFDIKLVKQRINLPKYIREYISTNALAVKIINFKVIGEINKYYLINPLDLEISFDNLISNSQKAEAKNILIEMQLNNDKSLTIFYYDDGDGVSERFVRSPNLIFELGARDSLKVGSGIGMYDVKKRISNMNGEISFTGNGLKLRGASFRIIIRTK